MKIEVGNVYLHLNKYAFIVQKVKDSVDAYFPIDITYIDENPHGDSIFKHDQVTYEFFDEDVKYLGKKDDFPEYFI